MGKREIKEVSTFTEKSLDMARVKKDNPPKPYKTGHLQ